METSIIIIELKKKGKKAKPNTVLESGACF
jgi:hypothetical protein